MIGWTLVAAGSSVVGPAVAQLSPAPAARPVVVTVPPTPVVPPAAPTVPAPPVDIGVDARFEAYKPTLAARARAAGVREATIAAVLPGLRLNIRAMQLDQAQRPASRPPGAPPSAPPLWPYLREHVTPSLITRGQARYHSLWPNLVWIHQRFGVDPAVVLAIYGKETSYGRITGNFDLLEVLASLAYEGRRRPLFEGEFVAALKLLDGGVARSQLRGSYAGATGFPQFMPSVVLTRRADGDGDGVANIWTSEPDALASIANYLRGAGWKPGVPWGVAASVPAGLNRLAIARTAEAPQCPAVYRRHSRELTMAQWRALGVVPAGQAIADTETAVLMEPDGPGRTAYLLTANYRAILAYNCSNFYGMSVSLLADAIARRGQGSMVAAAP